MSKIDKKNYRAVIHHWDQIELLIGLFIMQWAKQVNVAKPFVGVVSTWNEAAPCNTALMRWLSL